MGLGTGAFVGFIVMMILGWIPIFDPLIAGFATGCMQASVVAKDDICLFIGKSVQVISQMEGYIFVTSGPERLLEIAEDALKIEGVKMAHSVTGQFDVVAYIEFTDMDTLKRILDEFQSVKGVERTQTAVAIPPKLNEK